MRKLGWERLNDFSGVIQLITFRAAFEPRLNTLASFPQRLSREILNCDFKAVRLNTHTHTAILLTNRQIYVSECILNNTITLLGQFTNLFQQGHTCLVRILSPRGILRALPTYTVYSYHGHSLLFYSLCSHIFSPVLTPSDVWLFPTGKFHLLLKERCATIQPVYLPICFPTLPVPCKIF